MRPNSVKRSARAGNLALGIFCWTASPLMAECLGHAGYDFVAIDMQHGETNLDRVQVMLQALSATAAVPIVRVPANVPMYIQRVLDLGAYGVIVPQVDTVAAAQAAVASVRYAPKGTRSWGPVRGTLYAGADYFAESSRELLTLVMLESREALANAAAILAVDGVDGCFVGPADLNITLGHSPDRLPQLADETEAGIATIAAAARAAGKIAGIHAFSNDDARKRIAQGYRVLTVMTEASLVQAGAAESLRHARG